MDTNYSLSDLASVVNAGEGFLGGSGGAGTLIILFLIIFMLGGNGWNRDGYGQYATAASQQEILFGQQFQNLDNKMDRLGDGISNATYALNNTIHNAQDVVGGAVVSEGRNIQTLLASVSMDNQKNVDSVRYDMANFASAINSNIDNKFAALEKSQMQAQIDAQAQQLNQLYLTQQLCGVVRYPNSWTYNAGASPFCGCNNNCCM